MMKPITIDIQEFGPVRNSQIQLSPLTIFTGESGLGKSYMGFLCHYIYKVLTSNRILDYFTDRKIDFVKLWNDTPDGSTVLTLDTADIVKWMEEDVVKYVGWLVGNPNMTGRVKFNLPFNVEKIPLKRSEELVGIQNKEEVYWRISYNDFGLNMPAKQEFLLDLFFGLFVRTVLTRLLEEREASTLLSDCILLPPSRGSLMDCVSRPRFKGGMYDEFFNFKEQLFSSQYSPKSSDSDLDAIASRSILGHLSTKNNEVIYNTFDNIPIPLSAAASSVKELSPYWLWLTSFRSHNTAILFEEPEAHLHPSRQEAVADTFSYVLNMRNYMILTTHSDYLIKRINQLGRIYNMHNSLKLRRYAKEIMSVNKIHWKSLIDLRMVGAYLLKANPDGTSRIERIDSEDGISFESFDSVIEREMTIDDQISEYSAFSND